MPTIKISNSLGIDLISAASGPGSGISKYFSGNTAAFIASTELAAALTKPIGSLQAEPLGLGMRFAADGAFGTTGVGWTLSAGASVTVRATQSGKTLPGDKVFGHPVVVEAGTAVVDITFTPTLAVGLTQGFGDLQFGFSAGGSVAFRAGRVFNLGGGAGPALGAAIETVLTTGIVPANVLDLQAMREGDIGSVSGSGNLKFSAAFDVAQVINPLASVSLPLAQVGKVSVKAAASLEVGASVVLKGNYQIRVRKLAGSKVQLGYYKLASSQFEFDVAASAGVSVTAGKTELLQKLLGMLGDPKADTISLVDAGIRDEQILELQNAVEKSLSRSIAISLAGSFSAEDIRTKMFEYEVEIDRLAADGVAAVNQALQGDLSALTSRASNALPQGLRMVMSELDEVKSKKVVWKLNFLGIVNVLSVSELIRHGNALFNADTGELVVTDSVTAKKIRVETRPLEAETKKLRKLLMQSLVITAAFRASGAQAVEGSLNGSMSYFEQSGHTNRQTISDYLDNFVGTGLVTSAEKTAFLTNAFRGRASVFLDVSFTDADFNAMFFDTAGVRRSESFYDDIGRDAIARLIQPGDENEFRRTPMRINDAASNALWAAMSSAGPPSLHTVLRPPLDSGPRLGILTHDYIVVKWWADAMTKAAKAVEEMKAFIDSTGLSAEGLKDDPTFNARRKSLNKALSVVANDALPDFLDAWGVLALDASAGRNASLSGILLTEGPIVVKQR